MDRSVRKNPPATGLDAAAPGGTLTLACSHLGLDGVLDEQNIEFRSLLELIDLSVANLGGGAFLHAHSKGHSGEARTGSRSTLAILGRLER